MSEPTPRASELVALELARDARVVELARLVAMAAYVEPELLRTMRLRLMPSADAGLEADVWFSALVQGRDSEAMVFLPDVAELLRTNLAEPARAAERDAAWTVIRACHDGQSPMVLLEELATYLALSGSPESYALMERELGRAFAAVEASSDDSLARWAARTLPRMPEAVRTSEPALALAGAASRRLGGIRVRGIVETEDPAAGAWHAGLLRDLPSVDVRLRFVSGGLEIGQLPIEGAFVIKVPHTKPIILEIETPTSRGWNLRRETFTSVTPRVLPMVPGPLVKIRTIAGDEWWLRPDVGSARPVGYVARTPGDTVTRELDDLGWTVVNTLEGALTDADAFVAAFLGELAWASALASRGEPEAEASGLQGEGGTNLFDLDGPKFLVSDRAVSRMDASQLDFAAERQALQVLDAAATTPLREQIRTVVIALECQRAADWIAREATARDPAVPVAPPGTLLGREDVLDELREFCSGQRVPGGILALTGEAGIGKSAILAELARRQVDSNRRVVHLIVPPDGPEAEIDTVIELLTRSVSRTLGLPETGAASLADSVRQGLRDQEDIVLIVDGLDGPEKDEDPVHRLRPVLPAFVPRGLFVITSSRTTQSDDSQAPVITTLALTGSGSPWRTSNENAVTEFWKQSPLVRDGRIDQSLIGDAVRLCDGNYRAAEMLSRWIEGRQTVEPLPSAIGKGVAAVVKLVAFDVEALDKSASDCARHLLQMLIVARMPLPLKDLASPEQPKREGSAGTREGKLFSEVEYDAAVTALAPLLLPHAADYDREALVDRTSLGPWIGEAMTGRDIGRSHEQLLEAIHGLLEGTGYASPSVQWAAGYLPKYELLHLVAAGTERAAAHAGQPEALGDSAAGLGYTATAALVDRLDSLKPQPEDGRWLPNIEAVLRIFKEQAHWVRRDPFAFPRIVYDRLRISEGVRLDDEAVAAEFGLRDIRYPLTLRRALGRLPHVETDLPSVLDGHTLAVSGLAVDSKTSWLVSVGRDSMLYEWIPENDDPLAYRFGPFASVPRAVGWSMESRTAIVGHQDGTVSVVHFHDGGTIAEGADPITLRRELRGHTGPVLACAVSLNGKDLMTGGEDGTLRMWSDSDEPSEVLYEGSSPVVACGWLAGSVCAVLAGGTVVQSGKQEGQEDGQAPSSIAFVKEVTCAGLGAGMIVAGHEDGTATGRVLSGAQPDFSIATDPPSPVVAVAASEPGAVLATEHRIHRFHASSRESRPDVLHGHHDDVTALSFSRLRDREVFASGSRDGSLKIWDWESGREVASLGGAIPRPLLLAATDSRHSLAFPISPTSIAAHDLETDSIVRNPIRFNHRVTALQFGADDSILAVGCESGTVTVVSATSLERLFEDGSAHGAEVTAMAWLREGAFIVTGAADSTLARWPIANPSAPRGRLTSVRRTGRISAIAAHPDRPLAASIADDGGVSTLSIWDIPGGKLITQVRSEWARARDCCFSRDGRTLIASCADGRIRLTTVDPLQEAGVLEGHRRGVNSCAVVRSADHPERLVSASDDATLRVWNLDERTELARLEGHTRSVYGCALMPDGEHILSWSLDRTLKLWNLSSYSCVATTYGQAPFVAARMLPARRQIAALDATGMVWLMDLRLPGATAAASKSSQRNTAEHGPEQTRDYPA